MYGIDSFLWRGKKSDGLGNTLHDEEARTMRNMIASYFFKNNDSSTYRNVTLSRLGVEDYSISNLKEGTIANQIKHDKVNDALCGNGTCEQKNMDSSCFASEICASGDKFNMTIQSLLAQQYALVAYIIAPSSPEGTYTFIGCMTADTPSIDVKKRFQPTLDGGCVRLLSNVCVQQAYRRRGVAATLIKHMIQLLQSELPKVQIYLLVLHHPPPRGDSASKIRLASRAATLVSLYESLQFVVVTRDDKYVLMRYKFLRTKLAPTP